MGNVEVAWEDVISVIQLVRNHIIVIAAALVCMIAVMILAKMEKAGKEFYPVAVFYCVYCSNGISCQCNVDGSIV